MPTSTAALSRARPLAAVLVVLAGFLAVGRPAGAVVASGQNGLIVFESDAISGAPFGDGPFQAINPSSGVRTTITGTTGSDNEPSVSSNGNRIAFDNSGDIFVADFPTGQNRTKVTQGGSFGSASGCGGPSWNPDSSRLVFCGPNGVYTAAPILNAVVTQMTASLAGDAEPDFDASGTRILVQRANGIAYFPSDNTGVALLVDGSNPGDRHPRLLPAGDRVVFEVGPAQQGVPDPDAGLYTLAFPGTPAAGVRTKIQGSTEGDQAPFPSPDGTTIGFNARGNGIFLVNVTGQGRVQLTGTQPGDVAGFWSVPSTSQPPPSINGAMAIESTAPSGLFGSGPIVAVDPLTGARAALAGSRAEDNEPSVNPSGDQVAFESNGNIVIADFPSGNSRRIVTPTGGNATPTWSPDGTGLTFSCPTGICATTAAANSQVSVLSGSQAGDLHPSYSPDGQFVVFDNPGLGIVRIAANGTGGRTTMLGTAGGTTPDSRPRINPTGTLIFFGATRAPAGITSLAWPNGGDRTLLAGTSTGDERPVTSPDGTKIAFVNTGPPPTILYVNADGTSNRTVIQGSQPGDTHVSWARSGSSLPECPGHTGDQRPDVIGTNGNDVLNAVAGSIVCGLAGNDVLKAAQNGGNLLEGGEGSDVICARGNGPNDVPNGGNGIDRGRFDNTERGVSIERFAPLRFCSGS